MFLKKQIKTLLFQILARSIKSAIKEQGLEKYLIQLEKIVPDITDQYSTFKIDNNYLRIKVRALHAFQVDLVLRAIKNYYKPSETNTVIDIGDSSGTHISYLKLFIPELLGDNEGEKWRFISVNLDPVAIEKINNRGGHAILCRAEQLKERGITANIYLSFEMLEHLYDPIKFLKDISTACSKELFILTVPYVSRSRVGLDYIRQGRVNAIVTPENTHIFELSPYDWKLIFLHSGWEVVEERIYRQYPRKSIFGVTRPLWKKLDYEGFYGAILRVNSKWRDVYKDF